MNVTPFNLKFIMSSKIFLATAALILLVLSLLLIFPRQDTTIDLAHQELSVLASNIRNHYRVRPDYWGLNNESAVKNNLVPHNIRRGDKVISSLGREIIIGQDEEGSMVMPGTRFFMLTLKNLSKKTCIKIATRPFSEEEHLGLSQIKIANQKNVAEFGWGGNLKLPVSLDEAKTYCQNRNQVSWVFE